MSKIFVIIFEMVRKKLMGSSLTCVVQVLLFLVFNVHLMQERGGQFYDVSFFDQLFKGQPQVRLFFVVRTSRMGKLLPTIFSLKGGFTICLVFVSISSFVFCYR